MTKALGTVTLMLLALSVFAQPGGARQNLTGTGLSLQSPQPFVLVQDKPDPFLENQVAYIFWKLSYNGIFATITYEKVNKNPQTPRLKMDETAALFAGQNKPSFSKVSDTTFQGQPAALFEEEFFEPYAKLNMRRKMLAFGPAGDLTTINFSWPVDNSSAKAMAESIFNSIQKQGAVAAETSKMPETNWQRVNVGGLSLETPSIATDPDCGKDFPSALYAPEKSCYRWGKDFVLIVRHRKYNFSGGAPSPEMMLRSELDGRERIERESTLKTSRDISTAPFKVKDAEAVKLNVGTGFGTVATSEELVFIRRGGETWTVHVIRPVRWEFAKEAADRIISSLIMGTAQTFSAAPRNAREFFERGVTRYNNKDYANAEADFTEAIRLDPKYVGAYLMRAKIYCAQKLIMSAIHEEDKAIALGGKPETLCGRTKIPALPKKQ